MIVDQTSSRFAKPPRPADGQTLAFLAAALERAIADEYRDMLLGKAQELEKRLAGIDRVLTACGRCSVMDGLADKVDAVHVALVDLLSSLAGPGGAAKDRRLL